MEQDSSFPLTDGGGSGSGTMARSAAMHLEGLGRDRSTTPSSCTGSLGLGQSRAKEGQGAVGPAICAADVPAAEVTCGVDPGTSVFGGWEESNVLENWAADMAAVQQR
jgi:hypothetical protein